MFSVTDILELYPNLTSGSEFRFDFIKDERKFLVKVVYFSDNEIEINAAYKDNICPKIFCTIKNLKENVDNIDKHFETKFTKKQKSLGPVIFGEGCGFKTLYLYGGEYVYLEVKDINKDWSHDNRLDPKFRI